MTVRQNAIAHITNFILTHGGVKKGKERPVYYAALDFAQFICSNHHNILRYTRLINFCFRTKKYLSQRHLQRSPDFPGILNFFLLLLLNIN